MFTLNNVREMTPVAKDNIYLETPARGLVPRYVSQQAINAILGWQNFTEGIENKYLKPEVINKLAQLLQVSSDEIILSTCTSHGFNLLANSIQWKGTENIVMPACEHPSNYYPWMHLRRYGVEVRTVPCKNGITYADDLIKYVDDNTKIIAVSLVSFYPGAYLEVEKYAEIAKKHNALLVVDAIQAIGFRPVNPKKLGISALASAAYKGLMSPYGSGFLYIDKKVLEDLIPIEINKRNVIAPKAKTRQGDADYYYKTGAAKMMAMPTHLAGLASMNGALDILLEIGVDNIYKHIHQLAKALNQKLKVLGIKTALSDQNPLFSHIVCANREDGDDLVRFARKQKLFLSNRREGIRLGLHLYNNMDDIDNATLIIGDYLKQI
ncbi:aminotransferase class V-fold PLP-dependent enzyme [Clostridium sp. 'deep sea']|uniref:aminotransferase class V-fold PLP-dependent enzyme n=1 Tax=Clostridium sp. 'deep sea' TaxID=2779445 RepID=UPI001896976B|nr:aminotransferase class V-fold PLP-dependent enzyme [Clostridium sp. 'deep sea']QOR36127.1 aminotransferase class V-fold PLP-dependent enzyme [Clostridium sp. 'deep sea']